MMLRTLFAARAASYRPVSMAKQFSSTAWALKADKKKKAADVEEIDPKAMIKDLEARFDSTLAKYNKKVTEVKMGKANPQIFNKLKVKTEHGMSLFTDIAQTSLKGKFLTITVFDPKNSKRIISAILASDMNMNAVEDPKNPQLLKVALPSSTKELKEKQAKELKESFNFYKSSSSLKDSFSSIRSHALKELKKARGSAELIRKLQNDIEKTHKTYTEKLTNAHKQAEKTLK